MTPADIRRKLVDALGLDLIGPNRDSDLLGEVLPQAPSRWYLTGFLVPFDADEEQRVDETVTEEVSEVSDAAGLDDAVTPEPAAARRAFFPSSMGLSLLVSDKTEKLQVTVRWGDYRAHTEAKAAEAASEAAEVGAGSGAEGSSRITWRRAQREEKLTVKLPDKTTTPVEFDVPGSGGLKLALAVRPVQFSKGAKELVPDGVRSVSVFLVNRRPPAPDEVRDESFAFQAEIVVQTDVALVPRPNLRGLDTDDWDEQVADLQYRDAFEFAVGHGVATRAILDPEGQCRVVETCWIPTAEVEHVAPSPIGGVELGMEAMAELKDGADARQKLGNLASSYREWIDKQNTKIPAKPARRETCGGTLRTELLSIGSVTLIATAMRPACQVGRFTPTSRPRSMSVNEERQGVTATESGRFTEA
jgi:hypothetical protein